MTTPLPDPAEPTASDGRHAGDDLLASYAAGTAEPVVVWSVEAHLTRCGRCRSAVSAYVDAERLARNRSVLLVRVANPDGRLQRLLCRCGVPDHLIRLLAVTPSLRASWLLSVVGVLAIAAGEAAAVKSGGVSAGYLGPGGYRDPVLLVPFLLVAPLLVLAGVAAAFLPMFDPASRLAVAAPMSGFKLLLARSVCALVASLVLVIAGALVLPGPGWLPVEVLLPSLALCAFALAAATAMDPRAAAVTAGMLWALPAVVLTVIRVPLAIVQWRAQSVCVVVVIAAVVLLFVRRDRFELGWMR